MGSGEGTSPRVSLCNAGNYQRSSRSMRKPNWLQGGLMFWHRVACCYEKYKVALFLLSVV